MGPNDERESEKLKQAEAWLNDPDAGAGYRAAAFEFIAYAAANSPDPEVRHKAADLIFDMGIIGG
jgi:hypothetical protein